MDFFIQLAIATTGIVVVLFILWVFLDMIKKNSAANFVERILDATANISH